MKKKKKISRARKILKQVILLISLKIRYAVFCFELLLGVTVWSRKGQILISPFTGGIWREQDLGGTPTPTLIGLKESWDHCWSEAKGRKRAWSHKGKGLTERAWNKKLESVLAFSGCKCQFIMEEITTHRLRLYSQFLKHHVTLYSLFFCVNIYSFLKYRNPDLAVCIFLEFTLKAGL